MAGEQSSGRMLKGPPGKEEAFSPLPPTLAADLCWCRPPVFLERSPLLTPALSSLHRGQPGMPGPWR